MRALRPLAPLVLGCLAVGLVGAGCTTGAGTKSAALVPPSSSAPSARGSGDACAEVRQGIDAFNQGDFAGTVEHFTQAVPLARAQAAAHDTRAAEQLLAAVTYYAQLAPEAYPQASLSSPEFAKYKAITLGQCVAGQDGPTGAPSSPGLSA